MFSDFLVDRMAVTAPTLLIQLFMYHIAVQASPIQLCMITSYREVSYVQDTAAAILQQIGGLSDAYSLKIVAANATLPESLQPLSIQMTDRLYATGSDCESGEDTDPLPPCKVRQQSLDIVVGLRHCQAASDAGVEWVVLLEDDFTPCPGAMGEMASVLLQGLDRDGTKFARFTQGGGVVAFPAGKALQYAESLMGQVESTPCDRALVGAWAAGRDYIHPAFLFKHIGGVSTIPYRNKEEYRRAYSGLRDNECGNAVTV